MVDHLSIIIPARDAMPYLAESVASALDQSELVVEVLVVDGESVDGTIKHLASLNDTRLRYLRTDRNLPPAARRNIGIRHTTGDWILFLDADDLLIKDSLSIALHALVASRSLIGVAGIQRFLQGAHAPGEGSIGPIEYAPGVGNVIIHRQVFDLVGDLDETLTVGEFVDWMSRCRDFAVPGVTLATHTTMRREHATNRSRLNRSSYEGDYVEIIRRHLTRVGRSNSDARGESDKWPYNPSQGDRG